MPGPEQIETVSPETIERSSLFRSVLKEPLTWYTGVLISGALFNLYCCNRINLPAIYKYTFEIIVFGLSTIYNLYFSRRFKNVKIIDRSMNTISHFAAGMALGDIVNWLRNWHLLIEGGGIQIERMPIPPTPTPFREVKTPYSIQV